MIRANVRALALIVIGALTVALSVTIGTAVAGPDIGDVKDGFTIAAMVLGQVFTAGAVYGAIRGDIKHLHHAAANAQRDADKAHERIDEIYQRGVGERRR